MSLQWFVWSTLVNCDGYKFNQRCSDEPNQSLSAIGSKRIQFNCKSCTVTFVAVIGAASATALAGAQCWPRPETEPEPEPETDTERMTPRLAFRAFGAATDRRPAGASLPFKHGICTPQAALETDALLPSSSPALPTYHAQFMWRRQLDRGAMVRRNSGFTGEQKRKKNPGSSGCESLPDQEE